jgi:hypothetical protein
VLSTIAATARLSGLAAPRRIAFSEPRPGEPLAVLSLSWESAADMRPWLQVFAIDAHRPDASTVYGDYFGWSLMLTSPAPAAVCFCEVVHPLGCPGDDPVITGTPAEVAAQIGQHFGREANADECARLNSPLRALDGMGNWTTPFESALPQRTPGAAIDADDLLAEADGIPVDPAIAADIDLLPADVELDAETAEAIAHRHEPVRVVDVLTDDPDLTDVGRGDAAMAHLTGAQS